MKVFDVLEFLQKIAPPELAADYDNIGLLVGDNQAVVSGIVVSLDCTSDAIDMAQKLGANLIVTHHPIIFQPLKEITSPSIIFRLIKSNISVISAHTNLDAAKGGVNDTLCNVLEISNIMGISPIGNIGFEARIGCVSKEFNCDELAVFIKEKLGGPVKYVGTSKKIKTIAVCSGSGADLLECAMESGADALITADVKHSKLIEAENLGFALFDAGHFNTEDVIVDLLCSKLSKQFNGTEINTCHISKIKCV